MKEFLSLYIGREEVEFSTPPEILYNYLVTDLTNPTTVKNSFSKSITIEGTPQNNAIFGHYWNLSRALAKGGATGSYFNASRKTPFTLYLNGEIAERGYVKLDAVRTEGNKIQYDITLYGGIGEFFYMLTYEEDEVSGDTKLKMSDLNFMGYENSADEFNFNINKEAIDDAWFNISPYCTDSYMWYYLNFAPCYNGLPENFSTDKVIINQHNIDGLWGNVPSGYNFKNGYTLGNLPDKMNEWEVKDIRSYLQRPILRVKGAIEAIIRRAEAHGYTVELDDYFFNDRNPYWTDTWMTLPLLTDIEYAGKQNESGRLETGTFGSTVTNTYCDVYVAGEPLANMTSASFTGRLKVTVPGASQDILYPTCTRNGNFWHKDEPYYGMCYLQAVAYDDSGAIIGVSPYYRFGNAGVMKTEYIPNGTDVVFTEAIYDPLTEKWSTVEMTGEYKIEYILPTEDMLTRRFTPSGNTTVIEQKGFFTKTGFSSQGYIFEWNRDFTFSINTNGQEISEIRLNYFMGGNKKKLTPEYMYNKGADILFPAEFTSWNSDMPTYHITKVDFEITSSSAVYNTAEGVGSGSFITKQDLLNTDYTPADFLLSYAKLFGLYFTKNTYDNTIKIQTRHSFYETGTTEDLSDLIDKSKESNITPITFDSKWYDMKLEMEDAKYAKQYNETHNVPFGTSRLVTGYNLGSETTDLYENSIFKGAISCVENSKFYLNNIGAYYLPYMFFGFSYNMYNGDSATTINNEILSPEFFNQLGEYGKFFDVFDKPQFADKSGKGVDGSNVLLFFNGIFSNETEYGSSVYFITDDVQSMKALNGDRCWLLTMSETDMSDNKIASQTTSLPVFSRYIVNSTSKWITHSLDFGQPRQLYVPGLVNREESTIFYKFWKNYLSDLYSIDNRVLDVYVKLNEKPNPNWMKKFYWFDNSIWRLNEITDWNVSSYEATKMQFIKVLDKSAYQLAPINRGGSITLVPRTKWVSTDGGTVLIDLYTDDGGRWTASDTAIEEYNITPEQGTGDAVLQVTIPPATSTTVEASHWISVTNWTDMWYGCSIFQDMLKFQVTNLSGSQYVPQDGGTLSFKVVANAEWTVSTSAINPPFVHLSTVSGGSGETIVSAVVDVNLTTEDRGAQINFACNGNNVPFTLTQGSIPVTAIMQFPDTTFDDEGGDLYGTVSASTAWSISEDRGDIELTIISPVHGDAGITNVRLRATPNNTRQARSLVLVVTPSTGAGNEVTFTQPYIPNPTITLGSTGITVSYGNVDGYTSVAFQDIDTDNVVVSSSQSWLRGNLAYAGSEWRLNYNCSQNRGSTRTGTISLSYNGVTLATFTVQQNQEIHFGGTFTIDRELCVSCGSCKTVCPVQAVSDRTGEYVIDPDLCISCGACANICPASAIYESWD